MTGWGQEGPLAARRRPRHQLYRPLRHAFDTIGREGPPSPAGQLCRRFRRRRDDARLRHGQRPARGAGRRRGAGDRLRDDRRLGFARQPDLGAARGGPVEGRNRREQHRQRQRLITTPTRPPTANGSRSARSSRNSGRRCASKLGIARSAERARPQGEARRPLPPASATALVRPARRQRRLLRAGPDRSPRRPPIRTTVRAAPSSTSAASPSPPRRRAIPARRPSRPARCGTMRTPCWPNWAMTQRGSPRFGRMALIG